MKRLLTLSFAILASALTFAGTAGAKEIQIGINDVYVPPITSNADAYVVVNGIFQNGCYHWARGTVTNLNDSTHELRFYAEVTPGMCIMVMVPFTKEVQIGRLQKGIHRLRFLNGDDTYLERTITVD